MEVSIELPEIEEASENERSQYSQMENSTDSRDAVEVAEDDNEFEFEIMTNEINRIQLYSSCLLISFILLYLYLMEMIYVEAVPLPIILLEIKVIVESSIKYKIESQILSNAWNSEYLKNAIESLGDISTLIMLELFLYNIVSYLFFVSIPLIALGMFKIFFKISFGNSMLSVFGFVINTQIRNMIFLLKILVIISIGLKLHHIVNYNWKIILWPIWVFLFFWALASLCSIIFIILNLCSEKTQKSIISMTWIFITVILGFSSSLFSLLFLNSRPKLCIILIVIYLLLFLLFTTLKKKIIIDWLVDFFLPNMQAQLPLSLNVDKPLPLPKSQQFLNDTSISKKIIHAIRKTSRTIVSFSNNDFNMMKIKKDANPTQKKSFSYIFEERIKAINLRSRSSISFTRDIEAGATPKDSCIVCFLFRGEYLLTDCMHGKLCLKCARFAANSSKKCPLCKKNVTGYNIDS